MKRVMNRVTNRITNRVTKKVMKKVLKAAVPVFLFILVPLTGCGTGSVTYGEIPPPPHRQPAPAVPAPPTGGTVAGSPIETATELATELTTVEAAGAAGNIPADEIFTLSFAHVANTDHPRGYMIERFADIVEERSGGRLVVNVFPESQLGNDFEVMTQIMQDAIDLTSMLSANMTHVIPELALFDLPYLFFTMDQAAAALDGALGDYITGIMAEHGLVNFGFLTSGFKHLTNNVRPITSVQDLDGVQMRVSQSHFLVAQFQAINAGGISIPFGDLYAAFEAGLADGQENPFATIISARFYEVQDYITISNHGFTIYPIFISAEGYNRLPADLRRIVRDAFAEIQPVQWNMIEDAAAEQLAYLYTTDINVNYLSDEAMQGFREAMQVVYDEFAEVPGGATMLALVESFVN